uniref:Venom protein n=1 Tax=Hadrurus spadix TaxID=141984 RepID=A0A1W7R954_9SCOR
MKNNIIASLLKLMMLLMFIQLAASDCDIGHCRMECFAVVAGLGDPVPNARCIDGYCIC